MTANPFAALLAKIGRYSHDCDEPHLVPEPDGKWLDRDEVLAALAAAVLADLAEAVWKPIETAPRGGEWFMARSEHGQTRAVHYADEYDRFPISHDGVVWSTAPVEWMPLSVFPALLARIAAQEVQIKGLEAERNEAINQLDSANHSIDVLEKRVAHFMERAEVAETALATERAKVESVIRIAASLFPGGYDNNHARICAAITEAGQ